MNTRHWQWWNRGHQDKAIDIITTARNHNSDIIALTEMESGETFQNAIIEDYNLLTIGRVGLLVNSRVLLATAADNAVKILDERTFGLRLTFASTTIQFNVLYAPTSWSTTDLRRFWEERSAWHHQMSEDCLHVWIGDWNGHIGRHTKDQSSGDVPCGLDKPTTATGRLVKSFLQSTDLQPVDFRRVIA